MADLQGWPFLSPPKIPLQKCEKCSQEFCSTINYRRHMRLHRRNLTIDKDSTIRNRSLLQDFWDKLSVEESMEIMSFKDVFLEGVVGSSILNELTSLMLKSRCSSLPANYVKAGIALLDIVQARTYRFPISSQELFSILDEASEKTFLCAGTAGSLLKYVFAGDAEKIGHEMRNLIACTSFLIEQKLVQACLADKDAEALRYQKLLVEEEEAAQRRQAATLEKKRLKKLRQKEQRAKEQASVEPDSPPESSPTTPPIPSPVDAAETNREMLEIPHSPTSSCEPVQVLNMENIEKDHENRYPDFSTYQNVEHRTFHHQSGRRRNSHWQAPSMQRGANGFHAYHNYQSGPTHKHASNGGKVWAPKPKSKIDEESRSIIKSQIQAKSSPSEDRKHQVFIGSISVTLVENDIHEKPDKIEAVQGNGNRSTGKLWRPVSQHEVKDNGEVQLACPADSYSSGCEYRPNPYVEDGSQGCLRFSSHLAEAFLEKRWNEAIASDHVKLALFHEAKPPEVDNQEAMPSSKLDHRSTVLSSTENHLTTLQSSAVIKSKIGDKASKMKYVQKQRSLT